MEVTHAWVDFKIIKVEIIINLALLHKSKNIFKVQYFDHVCTKFKVQLSTKVVTGESSKRNTFKNVKSQLRSSEIRILKKSVRKITFSYNCLNCRFNSAKVK